jgi:hypothetical protein
MNLTPLLPYDKSDVPRTLGNAMAEILLAFSVKEMDKILKGLP